MCALHPNIVQLREVFLTADYLAVAMEYADGGDLSEHIDQQYQKGVSGLVPPTLHLSGHSGPTAPQGAAAGASSSPPACRRKQRES
jgi:serine/threonine protein kinase